MASEDDDSLERAAFYVGAQRSRDALEALRRADPADVRTYLLRGQALMQLERLGEAEEQFRRGLDLEPEDVELLMALAQVQAPRDAQAAELTLRKALAIEPENVALLSTYVFILMEQGRYEWAERMLNRAMNLAPEAMQATRAMFLLRAAGSGDALDAAQALLREMPDEALAHYLQGIALLRRGRASAGLRHLRQAAALRPADPLFPAAARTFGAWYLWPAHVTSGPIHYVLGALFWAAALAAVALSNDFAVFWRVFGPWLGFVAYKWIAAGVTVVLLKRRVARATRD